MLVLSRTDEAAMWSCHLGLSRLLSAFARVLGGALGRAVLHGCTFPGVAGQRRCLEELLPGTTMLPDTAEQVAGHRRQQVVPAKLGDVEQGQDDVQPRLRAERLGDRDAAVQLDDGGGAD